MILLSARPSYDYLAAPGTAMARHYLSAWWRLSRALVLPRPCVREKCGKNAGKMFFTLHANIISACGKNVFYRIDRHPPEAAGAAPAARARPGGRRATPFGRRHGLRPTATACGRHALPGERATPWRAIMHRNQDQGRSSAAMANRAPQSSLAAAAGPARCWLARSCCPCLAGSCSLLPALAPAWLWGSCLALALAPAMRVISGPRRGPRHRDSGAGAKRTWAAHLRWA